MAPRFCVLHNWDEYNGTHPRSIYCTSRLVLTKVGNSCLPKKIKNIRVARPCFTPFHSIIVRTKRKEQGFLTFTITKGFYGYDICSRYLLYPHCEISEIRVLLNRSRWPQSVSKNGRTDENFSSRFEDNSTQGRSKCRDLDRGGNRPIKCSKCRELGEEEEEWNPHPTTTPSIKLYAPPPSRPRWPRMWR